MEIGRLCVKTAGRDAGQLCVVVEEIDKTFVMVDGNTRRRKCNIAHLRPMKQKLDLKKGASHTEVINAFEKNNIAIVKRKPAKEGYKKQPSPKKLERVKKVAKKIVKKKEEKKTEKKPATKKATKKTTTKKTAKKTTKAKPRKTKK
jgi:large subunit ribosomal protein L14e